MKKNGNKIEFRFQTDVNGEPPEDIGEHKAHLFLLLIFTFIFIVEGQINKIGLFLLKR